MTLWLVKFAIDRSRQFSDNYVETSLNDRAISIMKEKKNEAFRSGNQSKR